MLWSNLEPYKCAVKAIDAGLENSLCIMILDLWVGN